MKTCEVVIGEATYEVARDFLGTKAAEALVLDRLLCQAAVAEPAFDAEWKNAV